jgi:putative ABC transport system permease protein
MDAVGGATGFPTVTAQRGTRFAIDGRTLTPNEDGALFIAATPDYFRTLRTPLFRGRTFDRGDRAEAQPVVVINRTLADTLFSGQDPVGRRVRLINPEQSDEWRTIVGVVGDVHYRGLASEPAPTIYTPFAQTPFLWLYVMARTSGGPESLMGTIRSIVPTVDPTLVAANLRTMDAVLASSIAEPRLNMLLISGFAALALLLAGVGIYGVVTYSVAQRTHEIGVRMALGAASDDVLRLVVSEGLLLAAFGVTLGLGGAAALTRFMAALLFGVTPRDPVTFGASALTLLMIAAIASWVPARRATRVDPMVALRAE